MRVKKTILSIATAAVVMTGLAPMQAHAGDVYSTTLQVVRQQKVDNLVKRIADLSKRVQDYILQTADTTPTLSEVDRYFGISDSVWKNYEGDPLKMEVKNNSIVISNIFSSSQEPQEVIDMFLHDPFMPPTATATSNSVTIPLDATTVTFMNKVNKLKTYPGVYVGIGTPPSTATKWYQPDGQGGLILYIKQGTSWTTIGSADQNSGAIVVDSVDDLKNIPASIGTKAYVKNSDGTLDTYIYDGKEWSKLNTTSEADEPLSSPTNPIALACNYGDPKMDDLAVEAIKKKTGKAELLNAWFKFSNGVVKYVNWSTLKFVLLPGSKVCLDGKCYSQSSSGNIGMKVYPGALPGVITDAKRAYGLRVYTTYGGTAKIITKLYNGWYKYYGQYDVSYEIRKFLPKGYYYLGTSLFPTPSVYIKDYINGNNVFTFTTTKKYPAIVISRTLTQYWYVSVFDSALASALKAPKFYVNFFTPNGLYMCHFQLQGAKTTLYTSYLEGPSYKVYGYSITRPYNDYQTHLAYYGRYIGNDCTKNIYYNVPKAPAGHFYYGAGIAYLP